MLLTRLLSLTACFVWGGTSVMSAAVALASPFGDHGVLQRDQPIAVWGTADAGESVTVTLDGKDAAITAGSDGKWLVKLAPHAAGGPFTMTIKGTNTITLNDLLIGEVWICSGQSNMEFVVKGVTNANADIAAANFPLIRHYGVKKQPAQEPQANCVGSWVVCSPETVGGFTAAGYYFAKKLHAELNVPIGLLHTSWGGTAAESWTSKTALLGTATFKNLFVEWDKRMAGFPAEQAKHEQALEKWKVAAAAAKAAGTPAPKQPRPPQGDDSQGKPSSLFNGMIAPLVPYTIRGAIWYQGEANAGRHAQYQELLSLMIGDWRQRFGQGDFPFYIVQLANYMKRAEAPTDSAWAKLRDAQYLTTTTVKHTGLATIIDIGEAEDIHPKNKQDVGLRLALNALALDYGKNIEYSGPIYKSLAVNGNKAALSFTHADGLASVDGAPLTGFAIAGADGVFVWAEAAIVGDTVVVSSAKVAEPKAVRYAWADNPACNLTNKAGLPAVPFKTDR